MKLNAQIGYRYLPVYWILQHLQPLAYPCTCATTSYTTSVINEKTVQTLIRGHSELFLGSNGVYMMSRLKTQIMRRIRRRNSASLPRFSRGRQPT